MKNKTLKEGQKDTMDSYLSPLRACIMHSVQYLTMPQKAQMC